MVSLGVDAGREAVRTIVADKHWNWYSEPTPQRVDCSMDVLWIILSCLAWFVLGRAQVLQPARLMQIGASRFVRSGNATPCVVFPNGSWMIVNALSFGRASPRPWCDGFAGSADGLGTCNPWRNDG